MLSTITARLTAENDEYIASITGGMGVIDKNTGELRSTFDILQDLSKAWGHLTSVEKQELAETVAGKTQRSLFTAIMTNFDTAVDATADALDSEGSATEENEKRKESLRGKIQQLQLAWQDLSRNTINSEGVKSLITFGTNILNLTNQIGGLIPVITALGSAFLIFKSGSIAKNIGEMIVKFQAFRANINLLKADGLSTFKALQLGLAGVKAGTEAEIAATTGLATAMSTLAVAAGAAFAAISIGVAIYNAIKNARDKANDAAAEEIKKGQENVTQKEETIKKTQEEIDKLKEEKKVAGNNEEVVKAKDDEIKKRQENIDTINTEIIAEKKKQAATAASMKTSTDPTGLGITAEETATSLMLVNKEAREYVANVHEINNALSQSQGNAGAYKRTLEDYIKKYSELRTEQIKNGESTTYTDKILSKLNQELKDNEKNYETAKQKADGFYEALKGINELGQDEASVGISEENKQFLKDFYDLNDEEIEQLKQGIDVKNEDADATNKQNENLSIQEEYLKGVEAEEAEYQNRLKERLTLTQDNIDALNDEIDSAQSAYGTLTAAVDEYNSSGGLSMDTIQQLLALDGDYLNSLELVNGQLQISAESEQSHSEMIEQDTMALIENAAMNDLQAMAAEASGSTAQSAAQKIQTAGENAKSAGEYAKQGAAGFTELAGTMAQAGMVNLDGVDVEGWAKKWAGITDKIKGLTSGKGGLKSSKFTGSSGSGKKSGSGSSKSTKEEYKAEINTLYAYENALDNAKDAVDRLNDALKDTDNFNEQEKILRQLIDATNNQINKTNELKNAQSAQMNDYINQLRAQGFAIDYNASKNELFINNMQHLADFSGDTAKNLEKLIKKIQDLNDDNRSLDNSVRDLTGDVKDYYEQLEEIPEKKLKKFNELMKEFQQGRLDQIQNQIDDIQHEMDNDPRLKQLEEQIEALEKQNDEIDKQKELEEKLLAVEEAKEKLANQRKQKNIQIYRENQRMGKIMPSSIEICCVTSNYIGQRLEVAET